MPTAAGIYYSEKTEKTSLYPPVILIHGAGTSHLSWPVELRRMPGFRVLAPDLPGHGRSTGLAQQSVSAYARMLVDFMVSLDIFQAVLVGQSMGGAIALETARQYPDRVAAMGLIASGAFFNIPESLLEKITSPFAAGEGIQQLKTLLFGKQTPAEIIDQTMRELQNVRSGVLAGDWHSTARFDLRREAENLLTPTWIAHGSEDRLVTPAQGNFLASAMPRARLQLVQGGSHVVVFEQPKALQEGLCAFLAETLLPKNTISWEIPVPLSTKKAP